LDRLLQYFEGLGVLEAVLIKLRASGCTAVAEQVQSIQDSLLDRALEVGTDIALARVLEPHLPVNRSTVLSEVASSTQESGPNVAMLTNPTKRQTASGKICWTRMIAYQRADGSVSELLAVVGRDPSMRPETETSG